MDITQLSVVPYWGWTAYTPVIPKMYWDVYSQEERIKLLCKDHDKLVHYASYLAEQITINNKNMQELDEQFQKFIDGEYDDYYEQKIAEWVDANMTAIMERSVKNLYFGLTDDGHFVAYIPENWNELMFDTGYVYGQDDYGRYRGFRSHHGEDSERQRYHGEDCRRERHDRETRRQRGRFLKDFRRLHRDGGYRRWRYH